MLGPSRIASTHSASCHVTGYSCHNWSGGLRLLHGHGDLVSKPSRLRLRRDAGWGVLVKRLRSPAAQAGSQYDARTADVDVVVGRAEYTIAAYPRRRRRLHAPSWTLHEPAHPARLRLGRSFFFPTGSPSSPFAACASRAGILASVSVAA
ncbi:hypothetical protein C8R45DRAFT_1033942 [Mycena sanguinolenta]|nr:hypothetical protein C8R45DRAFT_1033942 [Mycena sanguinolenta]